MQLEPFDNVAPKTIEMSAWIINQAIPCPTHEAQWVALPRSLLLIPNIRAI
jgi:hypothetical protein